LIQQISKSETWATRLNTRGLTHHHEQVYFHFFALCSRIESLIQNSLLHTPHNEPNSDKLLVQAPSIRYHPIKSSPLYRTIVRAWVPTARLVNLALGLHPLDRCKTATGHKELKSHCWQSIGIPPFLSKFSFHRRRIEPPGANHVLPALYSCQYRDIILRIAGHGTAEHPCNAEIQRP